MTEHKPTKSKTKSFKSISDKSHQKLSITPISMMVSNEEGNDSSLFLSCLSNFTQNYDDLINNLKTSISNNTNTKKINTSKEVDLNLYRNKSNLSPTIDIQKIENLVTNIQQKNEVQNLTNTEEIRDFYEYTENCLKLIASLKRPEESEIELMKIDLPSDLTKDKKLAIFDLDETLIHCELKNLTAVDRVVDVKMPSGKMAKVGIYIRPHIFEALIEIKKKYHMIIYTASDQSYADSVMNLIDPERELFPVRLYRSNCVKISSEKGNLYIKDLRIIRNVDLKNMIMIDNSVLSFSFHLENGIPILPFYSNKSDNELLFLRDHLINLSYSNNFTRDNGGIFNLKSLLMIEVAQIKEEKEENEKENEEKEKKIEKKDNYYDSHKHLTSILNQPVRKNSKFQIALEKTLKNARRNTILLIGLNNK